MEDLAMQAGLLVLFRGQGEPDIEKKKKKKSLIYNHHHTRLSVQSTVYVA